MDKFANEDASHKNAEEYVAVQSCIDECKGHDVFVLATVNDKFCLPDSLIRAGRFDKMNSDKDPQIEGVSEDSIILSDLDEDNTDTFWIIGKMQTDEQRETFKQFSKGSMVVIRGTITDITESTVSIDIDDME